MFYVCLFCILLQYITAIPFKHLHLGHLGDAFVQSDIE